ncbi:MAG TPA: sigma-70 family RNA polymerase sigma factor [Acidimicrobiales bacterium]|jgi:RNA polymerase sigma-70 factor (ECF subfamily)|nr:sigma-70 family RNA polymerase sigma factor [Acidimicrobiales bacterium]
MRTEPEAPTVVQAFASLDLESEAWIRSLGGSGNERDDAIARLHALLLRVARSEARRRANSLRIDGPELDDLAHQAASDALVAIVAKLEQFRGESRFTTWVYKFAVFEVSTKFRRHYWKSPPVAMESEEWERLPDRFGVEPERALERRALIDAMHEAVETSLTAHQREIFVAIVLRGTPLDVMVEQSGSNRNAIYKTLFDARGKLRDVLAANGHLGTERARDR